MPLLRPLAPGQQIGSFELLESLAEGPLATTWLARSTGDLQHARVALKTVAVASLEDAELEEAFLQDSTQASALRHPGVARLVGAGRQGAYLFAASEWIDGTSLQSLLRMAPGRGGVPSEIALRLLLDACDAVSAIHQAGLVHRALRPGNVMITQAGSLKILDAGVSAVLSRSSSSTTFRHAVGKFTYLSPEQLWSRPVDARSDVFCLGLLGYHLLTGSHPFQGANERETTSNILSPNPAPSLRESLPELPLGLTQTIDRALTKEPTERISSAIAMRDMILEASGGVRCLASSDEVSSFLRNWLVRSSSRPPPPLHLPMTPPLPDAPSTVSSPSTISLPTTPGSRRSLWVLAAVLALSLLFVWASRR